MVIYSSDSGLILVVCGLLIECLLATPIWHQNLAVPATQLTPSHLTSQYALILAHTTFASTICRPTLVRINKLDIAWRSSLKPWSNVSSIGASHSTSDQIRP